MYLFHPLISVRALVYDILSLLMLLIFVEAVIANMIAHGVKISPFSPFVKWVRSIVYPITNPIRRILPPPHKTYNMDLSPMVAMMLIWVVQSWLR